MAGFQESLNKAQLINIAMKAYKILLKAFLYICTAVFMFLLTASLLTGYFIKDDVEEKDLADATVSVVADTLGMERIEVSPSK